MHLLHGACSHNHTSVGARLQKILIQFNVLLLDIQFGSNVNCRLSFECSSPSIVPKDQLVVGTPAKLYKYSNFEGRKIAYIKLALVERNLRFK